MISLIFTFAPSKEKEKKKGSLRTWQFLLSRFNFEFIFFLIFFLFGGQNYLSTYASTRLIYSIHYNKLYLSININVSKNDMNNPGTKVSHFLTFKKQQRLFIKKASSRFRLFLSFDKKCLVDRSRLLLSSNQKKKIFFWRKKI